MTETDAESLKERTETFKQRADMMVLADDQPGSHALKGSIHQDQLKSRV